MDTADNGSKWEERFQHASLQAQLDKAPDPSEESLEFCLGCGEQVPEMRRELGGITHCVPCLEIQENATTGGREDERTRVSG